MKFLKLIPLLFLSTTLVSCTAEDVFLVIDREAFNLGEYISSIGREKAKTIQFTPVRVASVNRKVIGDGDIRSITQKDVDLLIKGDIKFPQSVKAMISFLDYPDSNKYDPVTEMFVKTYLIEESGEYLYLHSDLNQMVQYWNITK